MANMILPDYLRQALDVVFCGTAVGKLSAVNHHYYAGPRNKFWHMLFAIGLTPKQLLPQEDALVTEYGIGLTDLVKHHSGNDDILRRAMYGMPDFERRIRECTPRFLAFNGKKAAAIYLGQSKTSDVSLGRQECVVGRTEIFVLPSTSGSAGRTWDEAPWPEIGESSSRTSQVVNDLEHHRKAFSR